MGNVARNIGGFVSGAGSLFTAGISYIRPGSMSLPSGKSGFGSESITLAGAYNYDLPKQTNNYAPPISLGSSDEVIKP